ncbi:hypothetical protein FRC12_010909 [Ceratobasidium sp. 428]|nr:hypothetical protein FRC12_010909 [Ceratobasidium sp. 428]
MHSRRRHRRRQPGRQFHHTTKIATDFRLCPSTSPTPCPLISPPLSNCRSHPPSYHPLLLLSRCLVLRCLYRGWKCRGADAGLCQSQGSAAPTASEPSSARLTSPEKATAARLEVWRPYDTKGIPPVTFGSAFDALRDNRDVWRAVIIWVQL